MIGSEEKGQVACEKSLIHANCGMVEKLGVTST